MKWLLHTAAVGALVLGAAASASAQSGPSSFGVCNQTRGDIAECLNRAIAERNDAATAYNNAAAAAYHNAMSSYGSSGVMRYEPAPVGSTTTTTTTTTRTVYPPAYPGAYR
jgi:hypothetical protein